MEWVETTGRSVQEAKEAALDELGVDEVDAEFEVLAEAQTGLFGRLRSEARVRARVRPTAPRAKEDRRNRDRRRRGGSGNGGSGNGGSGEGAGGRSSQAKNGGSGAAGGGPASAEPASTPSATTARGGSASGSTSGSASGSAGTETVEAESQAAAAAGHGEDEPDGQPPRKRSRNRRRSPRGPKDGADTAERGPGAEEDDDDQPGKGPEVEVDMDRQGEVAVDFLTKLMAEMGLEAQVKLTRPDEDTVEVQLSGSDLGILIGPKGATLVAVQNLTRTVVFNETGGNNGHINVDVGGYRQKRTQALVRFATQVADQVKSTGDRTALEPMSAVDRKVVHDTISAIEGVNTISEGEEPRRRVVVLPG
jgi:spoIIIJ-associated protein